MNKSLHIAACISGGGRTLLNIQDRIDAGSLDATIDLVIASRSDCKGVELARERGFEIVIAETGDEASNLLDQDHHDLVCLCGWVKHLRIDDWMHGRVMNIHPALLPAFGGKGMYGSHVHSAVLESGVSVSGCSVHFVNDAYDQGPIVLQRACPVEEEDDAESLAERVFALECDVFPEAIAMFAEGRLSLADDRVRIAPP